MTHGTRSGYAKHGCRCADCTRAQRVYMKAYYRRKRSLITSEVGAKTSLETATIGRGEAGTSPDRGTQEGTS